MSWLHTLNPRPPSVDHRQHAESSRRREDGSGASSRPAPAPGGRSRWGRGRPPRSSAGPKESAGPREESQGTPARSCSCHKQKQRWVKKKQSGFWAEKCGQKDKRTVWKTFFEIYFAFFGPNLWRIDRFVSVHEIKRVVISLHFTIQETDPALAFSSTWKWSCSFFNHYSTLHHYCHSVFLCYNRFMHILQRMADVILGTIIISN